MCLRRLFVVRKFYSTRSLPFDLSRFISLLFYFLFYRKNIVEFRATTISPGPTEFTTISSKSIRDSLKGLTPEQAKQKIKDLMKEAMSGMGGGPPKRFVDGKHMQILYDIFPYFLFV